MVKRGVYAVFCNADEHRLAVSVGGRWVPMDEFVQTHTPVQLSGLTPQNPGAQARDFIGLMIADETEKKQVKATVGRA
jgi:hypothetical protein